jgi:chromate reductase
MRVLAISGSVRRDSYNTSLLRALAEEAPAGVEVVLWDGLKAIPPYDQDEDVSPGPETVEELRTVLRAADAVVFATPEYNSSIPGAFKNALDWASRPVAQSAIRNTPVAVIGASAGAFGAVWAQAELRKVLGAMQARVVDVELAVGHAHEKFDEHGALIDGTVRQGLRDALLAVVAEAAPRLSAVAA